MICIFLPRDSQYYRSNELGVPSLLNWRIVQTIGGKYRVIIDMGPTYIPTNEFVTHIGNRHLKAFRGLACDQYK